MTSSFLYSSYNSTFLTCKDIQEETYDSIFISNSAHQRKRLRAEFSDNLPLNDDYLYDDTLDDIYVFYITGTAYGIHIFGSRLFGNITNAYHII